MINRMNKKNTFFYILFFIIVALAFFLRFYRLDQRVFHHDESAVAYFTYRLFSEHAYSYDPSFHGPFMYYATSEMFRILGDTIYSARFLPAVLGSLMLLFLIPLRKYLGDAGTLICAFFFTFSPSFLYYSRFYREDIFIAFFSLLLFVCGLKFAEIYYHKEKISMKNSFLFSIIAVILIICIMWIIPGIYIKILLMLTLKGLYYLSMALFALLVFILIYGGYPIFRLTNIIVGAFALASLAALKENAYIMIALVLFFLFLLTLREKWLVGIGHKIKSGSNKILLLSVEVLLFIFLFLVFFSLYYTGNFLDAHGMQDAVMKAVSHWYEMHKIERIGGPFYFYVPIIALYELPLLVFGLLGISHYSYGKEKFKILTMFLLYWVIVDIIYIASNLYPVSWIFQSINHISAAIVIFLPLLVYAVITTLRSKNILLAFLTYWAITNFVIYSYLQEKVPWLVLNILLPLVIIAAMYLNELLPRLKSSSNTGVIILLLFLTMSSFFVYTSVGLNFIRYTDPAEPLIQAAQAPQKFSLFLDKINEISSQYQGNSTEIQVTDAEMETQFLWYMRHYNNVRWRANINSTLDAPLIVVHDSDGNGSDAAIVKSRLRTDYERLDSARMSWYWFKLSDITPGYLLYRKMDRPPSEYRVVLFYKPKYKDNYKDVSNNTLSKSS